MRVVGLLRFCEDPAYLAHMANDPVGYVPNKEEYKQLAATKGNAAFVNAVCALRVAIVAPPPHPGRRRGPGAIHLQLLECLRLKSRNRVSAGISEKIR